MISVSEALAIIAGSTSSFGSESVAIERAVGRVLAEDLRADRDMPPFDRVAMDGIAINYESFAKGQTEYKIQDIAAAGDAQKTLYNKQHCIEVMTGGVLPTGCDTVIRYEDVNIVEDHAKIEIEAIKRGQNIHTRAVDHAQGELIIKSGTKISTAEIGAMATLGKTSLLVKKIPRVLVMSTGDELVPIDVSPQPHQIRRSNVHQILSVLRQYNIEGDHEHLYDDKDQIRERLSALLEQYDAILMSGGVSKGKFDYLPDVLHELGVNKLFHRVRQRPGKPFWFGQYRDRCRVFAFPGNPISTYVCLHAYFLRWLGECIGAQVIHTEYAALTVDVTFKPRLTYFQQVSLLSNTEGRLMATPQPSNGSGDLASIARADAFIQLPEDQEVFKAGEIYPVVRFR